MAPSAAPAAAKRKSARGKAAGLTGVVRDVQQHAGPPMIVHFRIERHDVSGNRLAPLPVEMRGYKFSGAVSNGDQIRVRNGRWRAGTLRVGALANLTTGAEVRAHSGRGVQLVFSAIFLSLFFSAFGYVVYLFVIHVVLKRPG